MIVRNVELIILSHRQVAKSWH